jgi:site-specific DNA-methyltransferase (adenine-specific)
MIETKQEWEIEDCKDGMRKTEENSVDLIVTDPPYGYSFMGKDWDKAVPSVDIWQECLRILKPGAFAFIMSAPRQDVLAHNLVNLSDAGFETGFSSIYWTFASGFPKAGNVSKLIDKRFGAEREVVGINEDFAKHAKKNNFNQFTSIKETDNGMNTRSFASHMGEITEAVTAQAKALDGAYTGFSPKPAVEVIMVVMKPLSEKTYIDQAMANQHGTTWLDNGRIPYQSDGDIEQSKSNFKPSSNYDAGNTNYKLGMAKVDTHPANLLVSDDVLNDGVDRIGKWGVSKAPRKDSIFLGDNYGQDRCDACNAFIGDSGSFSRYFSLDAWFDTKFLPKEAQKTFPFMIVPKASKSEKGKDNKHPTVKPVKLFSWLVTIGSREGDLVVDPFLGSGVTLAAGRLTNRNVRGFEIDPQWEHLYADRCLKHTPSLFSY